MKRPLQTVLGLLVVEILFSAGCSGPAPPGADEAQLARGAAEDFLISTGPASSYPNLTEKSRPFTTSAFLQNFKQSGERWYEFKAFSITSQTLNRAQTEATVRGTIQALHSWIGQSSTGQEAKETVGFRLRLVKEQGKWLVDSIEWGAFEVDEKK